MAEPTDKVYLRNPQTGLIGEYSAAQAPELVQNWQYRPVDPAALSDYLARQTLPVAEAGKAFLEGAAGTLLPYAAPKLQEALGISAPEDILRREHSFPYVVGGLFATAVPFAGQAGWFGKGVQAASRFALPVATERLGAAAAGAVGGALPTTTALGRMTAAAADWGTQGVVFGASSLANHVAMSDIPLTAEEVLREMASAGILSGAIGAGGSAAVSAVRGLYGPATHAVGALGAALTRGDKDMAAIIADPKKMKRFVDEVPEGRKILYQAPSNLVRAMVDEPEAAKALLGLPEGAKVLLNTSAPTAEYILKNAKQVIALEKNMPGVFEAMAAADPTFAEKILQVWPRLATRPETRNALEVSLTDALEYFAKESRDFGMAFNVGPRLTEIESLLGKGVVHPGVPRPPEGFYTATKARDAYLRVADTLDQAVKEMGGSAGEAPIGHPSPGIKVYDPKAREQIEVIAGKMRKNLVDPNFKQTSSGFFEALRQTRKELDSGIKWDGLPGQQRSLGFNNAQAKAKELAGEIRDLLHKDNWGAMGRRQAVLDAADHAAMNAEKALFGEGGIFVERSPKAASRTLKSGAVPRWVDEIVENKGWRTGQLIDDWFRTQREVIEAYGGSGMDVSAQRVRLDNLERVFQDIRKDGNVAQMIKLMRETHPTPKALEPDAQWRNWILHKAGYVGLGSTAKKLLQAVEMFRSPYVVADILNGLDTVKMTAQKVLDHHISRVFGTVAKKTAAEISVRTSPVTEENYQRTIEMWNLAAANPEVVAHALEDRAGPIGTTVPPLQWWMFARIRNQATHINQVAPKPRKIGVMDPSYRPGKSELQRINRHLSVAADPYEVTRAVAEGRLTDDHIRAGEALWPATMNKIRVAMAERVITDPEAVKALPRGTQQNISQLLGVPLRWGHSAGAILGTQQLYQSQAKPQQAAPVNERKIRNVDLKHTKTMYATSTQATTRHLEGHT